MSKTVTGCHNTVTMRSFNSRESFVACLLFKEWNSAVHSDDDTGAWNYFRNILMSAINFLAPVKQTRIR